MSPAAVAKIKRLVYPFPGVLKHLQELSKKFQRLWGGRMDRKCVQQGTHSPPPFTGENYWGSALDLVLWKQTGDVLGNTLRNKSVRTRVMQHQGDGATQPRCCPKKSLHIIFRELTNWGFLQSCRPVVGSLCLKAVFGEGFSCVPPATNIAGK